MLPLLCRRLRLTLKALGVGVHMPNNWVLGLWALVIVVQAWGKYIIIGYLGTGTPSGPSVGHQAA